METFYFYVNCDFVGNRQYSKIGITRNPRARLNFYNSFQITKYILFVKFNTDKKQILELEKKCLDATIKYYDKIYGCSIEGRFGNNEDVLKICHKIISEENMIGEFKKYDENDFKIDKYERIQDNQFLYETVDYFENIYNKSIR